MIYGNWNRTIQGGSDMGNALSGKVAFVTGAAAKRGMGRAVAVRMAMEGADVMVTDKFAAPKSAWAGDEKLARPGRCCEGN